MADEKSPAPDDRAADRYDGDVPLYGWPEPPPAAEAAPRRGRGRAAAAVAAIALVGALAGGVISQAIAGAGFGPPPFHMGPMMSGALEPAEVDKRVERMVKHFGVEVDATAEQQGRLTAIARAAVGDLLPLREQARQARREAVDLLAASTVDRTAVEALRAAQVRRLDEASVRLSKALADAAEVLTPDQRKELAERIRAFQDRRDRWFRG